MARDHGTLPISLALCVGLALPQSACEKGQQSNRHEFTVEGVDDENDVQVSIDEVPAAVREAILARVGGGRVHEIERSTTSGVTRYEVEVFDGAGASSEFVLAADGSLVTNGDDDDGPDDDDDGPDDDEP